MNKDQKTMTPISSHKGFDLFQRGSDEGKKILIYVDTPDGMIRHGQEFDELSDATNFIDNGSVPA